MQPQQNTFNFTPDVLASSTPLTCQVCGGEKFKQSVMLRKINRLAAATPKDVLLPPIPVFECTNCQTVLEDLLPEFVKLNGGERNV